ncbi:MAG: magnesium chelatase domain-containing protein [Candidatus Nanopelagicales bacterium]
MSGGVARTRGVVLLGVDGHVIGVEAHVSIGVSGFSVVGMADKLVGEARDRCRSAVLNTGLEWPGPKNTVGLSPAELPKRGPTLDLAIALALLAASGQAPLDAVAELVVVGELGLDGRVRPVRGRWRLPSQLTLGFKANRQSAPRLRQHRDHAVDLVDRDVLRHLLVVVHVLHGEEQRHRLGRAAVDGVVRDRVDLEVEPFGVVPPRTARVVSGSLAVEVAPSVPSAPPAVAGLGRGHGLPFQIRSPSQS